MFECCVYQVEDVKAFAISYLNQDVYMRLWVKLLYAKMLNHRKHVTTHFKLRKHFEKIKNLNYYVGDVWHSRFADFRFDATDNDRRGDEIFRVQRKIIVAHNNNDIEKWEDLVSSTSFLFRCKWNLSLVAGVVPAFSMVKCTCLKSHHVQNKTYLSLNLNIWQI